MLWGINQRDKRQFFSVISISCQCLLNHKGPTIWFWCYLICDFCAVSRKDVCIVLKTIVEEKKSPEVFIETIYGHIWDYDYRYTCTAGQSSLRYCIFSEVFGEKSYIGLQKVKLEQTEKKPFQPFRHHLEKHLL